MYIQYSMKECLYTYKNYSFICDFNAFYFIYQGDNSLLSILELHLVAFL